MSNQLLRVSKISYPALAFKFLVMILLALLFGLIFQTHTAMYAGLGVYILWSYGSKLSYNRYLMKAKKLQDKNNYLESIEYLEKYIQHIQETEYIDRHRWFYLLSESKFSFLEIGYSNLAASYIELGQKEKAVKAYRELLTHQPDSVLAQQWLRTAELFEKT